MASGQALLKKYQINIIKIIKIAIGSSIAILLAEVLGLKYSASAGIITLLSIQDTKKETLKLAGKRFLAFLFAITAAYLLFQSIGYYTHVFGLFLLVFITGSYLLRLQDGISMCSVMVTHFLIEKNMEASFIGNELAIFGIGILVGILCNIYIPARLWQVKSDMDKVEQHMKNILGSMAECILFERQSSEMTDCSKEKNCKMGCCLEEEFAVLNQLLSDALLGAYANMNNTLLSDTRYYIQYFDMRKSQLVILEHIKEQLCLLTQIPKQVKPISMFIQCIGAQFHEYNNAERLLFDLEVIKEDYKEEPNPATREEFENRAILYLILYDLESFLKIKRDFVRGITKKQIETFWEKGRK
ncbi:membrane protein [Anaerocolumna cellulosilytica]|uniref:Membrane protein n=1 Tax=Anaerocolumna cellulosilytica TaxID=433286 RepID=A0A6S6QZ04_9FIRM|nr:aromatic acid exporter family protein [Anaerocolumna cellulosilytica]MBB5195342.1 uncharacterized membrane protein YgaE (UPF0421/DUF939 family) [Anaerocolumna cellulosilytica]BCJ95874.1 membrane protein [Anaerocolumna cellulosilytica]